MGKSTLPSTETQPSLLGPQAFPFPPSLGARSQGAASGLRFSRCPLSSVSLAFRGPAWAVLLSVSSVAGSGLLGSGVVAVSNLFLHFASFSLLCLSPLSLCVHCLSLRSSWGHIQYSFRPSR